MYQALSRGIRATSHEDLLEEERQKAIQRGEDPDDVKITVEIYKHASLANTPKQESIDLTMYRYSEYKDRNIKRIMRIMKQVAVGCQIHYNRNVRDTDVDYSPTCDYDVCKYECADPAPDYEDYTTYDVMYSNEILEEVTQELAKVYKVVNSVSITDLFKILSYFRKKYIVTTLEKIISEKIQLVDRFGYPAYLREDNGLFYLDRTYPTGKASNLMSYYSTGLIAIDETPLQEVVTKLESVGNKGLVEHLYKVDPSSEEFSKLLEDLDVDTQTRLL